MVWVRRRIVDNRVYYEMRHDYRINGKDRCATKYIGNVIPDNIDQMKRDFLEKVNNDFFSGIFSCLKGKEEIYLPSNKKAKRNQHPTGFGIYFTFVSQRISGSSIPLLETIRLIENGRKKWERPFAEAIEAQVHYEIFQSMLQNQENLSEKLLIDWHWKLFRRSNPRIAGLLRERDPSGTGGKEFPAFTKVPKMLDDFFTWYSKAENELNPVLLAGLVHSRLSLIRPFDDGNGRIRRLATNLVLHRNGYPMFSFGERQVERSGYEKALEIDMKTGNGGELLKWLTLWYKKRYLSMATNAPEKHSS